MRFSIHATYSYKLGPLEILYSISRTSYRIQKNTQIFRVYNKPDQYWNWTLGQTGKVRSCIENEL